jgi:hypothetical protein
MGEWSEPIGGLMSPGAYPLGSGLGERSQPIRCGMSER